MKTAKSIIELATEIQRQNELKKDPETIPRLSPRRVPFLVGK